MILSIAGTCQGTSTRSASSTAREPTAPHRRLEQRATGDIYILREGAELGEASIGGLASK